MKNQVTNLALLRGGSPEPRALCGPVFVCLLLEPCLLAWSCLLGIPRAQENQAHGHPCTRPCSAQISLHLAAQTPELDDHVVKFQDSGHTRRYPERLFDFHWSLKTSWLVVPSAPQAADWPLSPRTHYVDASPLLDHKL